MTSSPFYTADHEAFRDVVRRFVQTEIEPFAYDWDEAGTFPRELYEKAAAIGLLGLSFPEEAAPPLRYVVTVKIQSQVSVERAECDSNLRYLHFFCRNAVFWKQQSAGDDYA